ncbi:TPA: hypothetical protein DEP34_04645 [Candidatus Uhrbacteria bacterium]|uniref:DUF11 domain-containing protein n=2 Tax=Candidatus Uhriibacteriota TaxID=1752732 RepID=A0A0G1T4C0_9BACT|nr:MAG: hypothetical protein UX45_C0031G0003 [Candidatus Uhrbacteria bacterium GW2011_GWF2_46_218]KKU40275.1 MAG: hypothetical protein UX57_C0021G0007 [Candidatus Uhrbacteria bacterium GW2011_GWE2_46_68]HBK34322.1 hypothetical protein [Candidatus Uhrbacteria bacterium]HCB19633.1 hypothetical protein [Candidatus Uhrbacteria bacterium]
MPLVPKRKRSSKEIRDELKKIYVEKDGRMPNLSHMQKQSSSRSTRFLLKLVLALLVISAVAWGGFLLWTQTLFENTDELHVTFEGPDTVKAGETVYYTIAYENIAGTSLEDLTLTLHLPDTFTITQTSPEPTEGERWNLADMTPQSDGKIMIGGMFRSDVKSAQTLQALITYRPSNTHANFQTLENKKVTVDSSVLEIAIEGPQKSLTGDEVTYTLTFQNTGDNTMENAAATILIPEGFEITSAEPAQEASLKGDPLSPPLWKFSTLLSEESQTITLKGQFVSTSEGTQTLTAQALFVNENDAVTIQESQDITTEVMNGALTFHLILNGTTESQTTVLGKNLRGSIDFENTGSETLEGLSFTLTFDVPNGTTPIVWDEADLGGGEKKGAIITWSEETLEELGELSGGEEGVIDFTLPLSDTMDLEIQSDVFTMTLAALVKKSGDLMEDRAIQAPPITITLLSDTLLDAQTRYYLDDETPIGTGSIPPKVGQVSSYGIVWILTNSLHPLESVVISTTLPSHVNWTDQASAEVGTLSYDPVTRVMTWSISSLPTSINQAQAWFGVGFTPTQDDVGTFLKLANPSSLTCTDSAVDLPLSASAGSLTTDLSDDPSVSTTGVVVE